MSQAKQRNGDSRAVQQERHRARHGGGGGASSANYSYNDSGAANLVQVLNQSDLPESTRRILEAELNPDHVLGNLREEELRYRRFSLWNNKEMVIASFPPKESIWQGEARKQAGLGDGKEALSQEQLHWIRDAFDAAFARTTRSRNGWQQTVLAEQTQERRIVEEGNEEEGNFLSRLVG